MEHSSNEGGLIRWPVKILLPLGFFFLTPAGRVRDHQADRLPARPSMQWTPTTSGRCNDRHAEQMAPLMFASLVFVMLIGFPVAFSLAALGLGAGLVSIQLGFFPAQYMSNLPLRVFGILSNELLLAIPFFTFMGAILERCGLAEDLLEGTGQLFGSVPGGLAYAVVLVGAVLGAITGTVAASVIAMGVISLPIMMRYGYNMRLATGVIAASGHDHAGDPAVAGAGGAGRPARPLGRRHVQGRDRALDRAGADLPALHLHRSRKFRPGYMPPLPPEARTLSRLAAVAQGAAGHGARRSC